MAPSKSQVPEADTPSQTDTPMTDANEEAITSGPADGVDANMMVSLASGSMCCAMHTWTCLRHQLFWTLLTRTN